MTSRRALGQPFVSVAEQLAAARVTARDVRLPGPPRKQRAVKQPSTRATGPVTWVWSLFGSKAHLFAQGVRGDATGYVSRCGLVQRYYLVPTDGKRGDGCELCKEGARL